MGGREPRSKRGVIRNREVDLPKEVLEILISDHLELGTHFGMERIPREVRGWTKNLWQDPLAIATGAAAEALQTTVPPVVGGAAEVLGGLALSRGGNALGGSGGAALKTAGLSLLGLSGGKVVQLARVALNQPRMLENRLYDSTRPILAAGQQYPPLFCPNCGKQMTSSTEPHICIMF